VFLDNDNAAAFGGPTIYSVPYALDKLRSAFEALAT
jgi:iron complex transport system substrate-binding protein